MIEAQSLRPFGQCVRLAIMSQQFVVAAISGLFDPCSPVAVIRAIGAIIVASFDGVLRGRLASHISQEWREVLPSFADRYSSTAVILETCGFRVMAAFLNTCPCSIFWSPASICRIAVRGAIRSCGVYFQAATRTNSAPTQLAFRGLNLSTTDTDAQILDFSAIRAFCQFVINGQSSENGSRRNGWACHV